MERAKASGVFKFAKIHGGAGGLVPTTVDSDEFARVLDYTAERFNRVAVHTDTLTPSVLDIIGRHGDSGATGRIVSVAGANATVDFNHPLAGKTLVFEITLASIGRNHAFF